MCSSSFGPATIPSLVTWPTSTTAAPRRRAMRTASCAHSRTCMTEPGAESTPSMCIVCIESMMSSSGGLSSTAADTAESEVVAANESGAFSRPRRRARRRSCSAPSSPET